MCLAFEITRCPPNCALQCGLTTLCRLGFSTHRGSTGASSPQASTEPVAVTSGYILFLFKNAPHALQFCEKLVLFVIFDAMLTGIQIYEYTEAICVLYFASLSSDISSTTANGCTSRHRAKPPYTCRCINSSVTQLCNGGFVRVEGKSFKNSVWCDVKQAPDIH